MYPTGKVNERWARKGCLLCRISCTTYIITILQTRKVILKHLN